tara:strand:- start:204 stop:1382 length:1179 start_codon:yes stop_codon:yes gene_type:complete
MHPRKVVDLVIVGGGIAGLWLANLFVQRGYSLLLLEAHTLGGGQTLASQGMIHGGLKYSLDGNLSPATAAIAHMPARWRACLAGSGELDLRALTPLCQRYFVFAQGSLQDRLTAFFASKLMRGRIDKLTAADYPAVFQRTDFTGTVYGVDDLVIDTAALVRLLRGNVAGHIYRHALQADDVALQDDHVTLTLGEHRITARQLVLCAGAGNGPLLGALAIPSPRMQLRGLHQAMVFHQHTDPMYAHCLTGLRGSQPRLTITTHARSDPRSNQQVWYLGGQLAEDGVSLNEQALAEQAREELRACVGWLNWDDAKVRGLRIDRAEPLRDDGGRPDDPFVEAHGPVLTCWPVKLSLAPALGDAAAALLAAPVQPSARISLDGMAAAPVGQVPWEH